MLRPLPDSQYFGVRYYSCGNSLYFQIFPGSVLRLLQVLAGIRPFGTARTASTRSTKILSLCAVYLEYDVYFDHRCTVSIISCPLFVRKHSHMVPRVGVGANYFRWGQLEYFEYGQYFVLMYCEYSQHFEVLYCGYCLCSKYFGVRYCGYCLYVLGVLYCSWPYSQYSQYLGLQYCSYSKYSQYLGRQYSNTCLLYTSPSPRDQRGSRMPSSA